MPDFDGVEPGGALSSVWQARDTIGIFTNNGMEAALSLDSGSGMSTAVFSITGWNANKGRAYSAFCPCSLQDSADPAAILIDMGSQCQMGNGSSTHITAYDFRAARQVFVGSAGSLSAEFQHLVGILHLRIAMPKGGSYTALVIHTDGTIATTAQYDSTTGSLTPSGQLAIQSLTLKDVSLADTGGVLDTYLAMLPNDFTAHPLYVKVYDSEGNIYSARIGAVDITAGHISHLSATAAPASEGTGLPVMIINTPDNAPVNSLTRWQENTAIAILDSCGRVDYDNAALRIRGRGNTTWSFPKKPYALKLEARSKLLGMKKHKRWCLLANWVDRTLLRNEFAFQIARQTALSWTPNGRFVELILNGQHQGNYYLCEQIRVDKNRLNIAEMTAADTMGDALTGGYLVELDIDYDEKNCFMSSVCKLPYMFKSPDADILQPEQMAYFQNYVNEMEQRLYADDWLEHREYADYMDIGSFVDWWLVHELAMNREPNWPRSTYMHKDRIGKLTAGPVWDFDYSTFVPSRSQSFTIWNAVYYERLFSDPAFVAEVKARWETYKPRFRQVPEHVRSVAMKIRQSAAANYAMWPLDPSLSSAATANGDQDLTFDEAVERLIDAYETKFAFLDEKISDM